MLLITTSRDPCKNTRKLAHALARLLGAEHATRGKKNVFALVDEARSLGAGRVLVINECKGNPSALQFMRVTGTDWEWANTFNVRGVVFPKNRKALPVFAGLRAAGPLKERVVKAFGIEEDDDAEMVLEATPESLTFKNTESFLQLKLAKP